MPRPQEEPSEALIQAVQRWAWPVLVRRLETDPEFRAELEAKQAALDQQAAS